MGSVPKFKAGDPVWVRSEGDNAAAGEYKGEIIKTAEVPICPQGAFQYRVNIEGCPSPTNKAWIACEHYLRPRRDDYQQHEPLGNRADLDKPLCDVLIKIYNPKETV